MKAAAGDGLLHWQRQWEERRGADVSLARAVGAL